MHSVLVHCASVGDNTVSIIIELGGLYKCAICHATPLWHHFILPLDIKLLLSMQMFDNEDDA